MLGWAADSTHPAERQQLAGQELVLNGAGIRSKLVFDVYHIALYAPHKSGDAGVLINQAAPRRLVLTLLRNVDSDALYGGLEDGLLANEGSKALDEYRAQLGQLKGVFQRAGDPRKGDVIVLDLLPGKGVAVTVRGQPQGVIAGEAFARGVLSIWLGSVPVQKSLKEALLGRP
ncbi:chalcone isomerase family protein [Chitinibacteraceae bacterium HSL-7]